MLRLSYSDSPLPTLILTFFSLIFPKELLMSGSTSLYWVSSSDTLISTLDTNLPSFFFKNLAYGGKGGLSGLSDFSLRIFPSWNLKPFGGLLLSISYLIALTIVRSLRILSTNCDLVPFNFIVCASFISLLRTFKTLLYSALACFISTPI